MKRFGLASALALGLAVFVTPAFAREQAVADPARVVPVRFGDLDASSSVDAERLLARLQNAATRACAIPEVAQPGPTLRRAIETCEANAVENAVARINAPELTRLYRAQAED